ncbi:MAG: AEC family transporter, partial [Clostridiales bacterium]|nr:AEC family transporter [Clostridiales bacterium]
DLSTVDIRSTFDLKFVLFCAVVTSICFWGIWLAAKIFLKDQSLRGAFVQASFRSSAAVMGLAFINNIYGSSAMGPMMIIGAVPLYNIYSVIVLTFEAAPAEEGTSPRDTGKIKEACINVVKNPIIIAIVLGVAAALLEIDFPTVIDKTISSVSQLATPLALIALGAGYEGRKALAKMKPTLWASAIKLVIQPMIFIPAAVALGFTGEKLIAILIMLAAPATPSCYIMAKNMRNDGELTASIVVVTTLLAAFTLTGWIYLLKMQGLI